MTIAQEFKRTPKNKPIYQFDPLLGYWGIPNVRQKVRVEQDPPSEIQITHNEQGLREASLKPLLSKEAILCLGGSHTWGGGVAQEDRYTDLLARRTGRRVINMGHCSFGIDQVAIAILKRTQEFNPAIIVVEQYPWAVVRLFRNYLDGGYIKPYFFLDEKGELHLKKVPWLARFSLFRKYIGSFYNFKKELQEFQKGIDLREGYDRFTDPMFLYWKISQYDYLYTLLGKIILVIRDYCRQNDIRLFFALGAVAQQLTGQNKSRLVDFGLPVKRLRNILDECGVAYADMADTMLREHSEDAPVIFKDGHINVKGHNVFATVLQKDLEKRGWI